jgi:hypothetical protein
MSDASASSAASTPAFEKLGLFYLGRRHDPATSQTLDEPVLYDSRDLVTHAVCVGMTGSGKTGLCLGLIEEAAIDGVPVIAIDPKGDLGNLLLTFPRLSPDEFRPWVNEDDARRAGMSVDAFAADQAKSWASGLQAWGQDAARVQRLRDAAEFTIFTPGSRAGRPVSILSSFSAPAPAERDDAELLAERANGTATSALVLAGVDAPPRSREHSLVAALLTHAWRSGADLDLAGLIRQVQTPPFDKVGVVDLESFFPAKDRFELAMQLNGVLAAPGFETWLDGEPLDPQGLFYSPEGRPRVSIFSIAHLGDVERMFFVSLLMNQMVGWMRRQTGTTSLRAMLYMDEILGYFPPVANPPSKPPLLTLLKQGRAFGLGVVLATQNPVDLDYKGLANTGTWFLGRLQTERDKARVLDGLEGVSGGLDRAGADRVLSALKKRVFLMHNVHDKGPTVFETRWTLSYLRGPLSRDQIKSLTPPARTAPPGAASAAGATALPRSAVPAEPVATGPSGRPASSRGPGSSGGAGSLDPAISTERPVVPPGIQEWFIKGAAETATYAPGVLGAARVSFSDRALGVDSTADVYYFAPVTDDAIQLDWAAAERLDIRAGDLSRAPGSPDARFAPLPAVAAQPKKYPAWEKSLKSWLGQNERVTLLRHTGLDVISRPAESERDFRIRLQHEARAARDAAVDAVRRKFASKQAALAERLRRAEQTVEREAQQASDSKMQTAVSMGATLLGAWLGRKAVSVGTLGRATTAARGVGRSMKEASDVKRAAEGVESVKAAIAALEGDIAEAVAGVAARIDQDAPLEQVSLAPKRGQVEVQFVALAWKPEEPPARRA